MRTSRFARPKSCRVTRSSTSPAPDSPRRSPHRRSTRTGCSRGGTRTTWGMPTGSSTGAPTRLSSASRPRSSPTWAAARKFCESVDDGVVRLARGSRRVAARRRSRRARRTRPRPERARRAPARRPRARRRLGGGRDRRVDRARARRTAEPLGHYVDVHRDRGRRRPARPARRAVPDARRRRSRACSVGRRRRCGRRLRRARGSVPAFGERGRAAPVGRVGVLAAEGEVDRGLRRSRHRRRRLHELRQPGLPAARSGAPRERIRVHGQHAGVAARGSGVGDRRRVLRGARLIARGAGPAGDPLAVPRAARGAADVHRVDRLLARRRAVDAPAGARRCLRGALAARVRRALRGARGTLPRRRRAREERGAADRARRRRDDARRRRRAPPAASARTRARPARAGRGARPVAALDPTSRPSDVSRLPLLGPPAPGGARGSHRPALVCGEPHAGARLRPGPLAARGPADAGRRAPGRAAPPGALAARARVLQRSRCGLAGRLLDRVSTGRLVHRDLRRPRHRVGRRDGGRLPAAAPRRGLAPGSAVRVRNSYRAAIGVIVAALALLFFAEGAALPTAWLPIEEAASLQHARGGGSAQSAGSLLYPAVLAPAARSLSTTSAYRFAQALSAVLWALTAIPAYLLARRLVGPRASLVVAVLAVAAPGAVYATAAVPDALALLLAVSSLPLLARASERGSGRDLAGALALATAAAFARPWFVVLPPALLVAYELRRGGRGSFLRWPRSLVFAGYAVFAYLVLARTAPEIGSALTDPAATARAAAASLAVVVFGAGIIPWFLAAAGAPLTSRPETALLATCLPALVLAAGVFGAAEGGLDERPLLALVPLVLALAAAAWLGSVAVPLRLAAPDGASRTFFVGAFAVAAVVAFVLLFGLRARSLAVPAAVAVVVLAGHAAAWSSARAEARAVKAADPAPRGWVDDHVGTHAQVFAVGPAGAFDERTVAELTLWNRSIRGTRVVDPSAVDPKIGLLAVSDTPVVLVRETDLVGTEVARSGAGVLLRPSIPLQVSETVEGLFPDGWSGPTTTYRRFGGPPRPGKVVVVASRADWGGPDRPSDVRFQVGTRADDVVELYGPDLHPKIHSKETLTRTIDVPPPPFVVVVTIDPTFSPADFGASDPRQLGAKLRFTYRPGK